MPEEQLLLEYDGSTTLCSIVFSNTNYGRVFEFAVPVFITRIQVKLCLYPGLGDEAPANLELNLHDTPTADGVLPDIIKASVIANPGLTEYPTLGWVEFPFNQAVEANHRYLLLADGWAPFPWGNPRYRIQSQPDTGVPANERKWAWFGHLDPAELRESADWTTSLRIYGYATEIPEVTTDPVTDIVVPAATLNGTLDDDGGEACDCGFEWGETVAYEQGATATQSKTTGQSFAQAIGGIESGKTYHYRALATNAKGTGYGVDRTFQTIWTTQPASSLDIKVEALNSTGCTVYVDSLVVVKDIP